MNECSVFYSPTIFSPMCCVFGSPTLIKVNVKETNRIEKQKNSGKNILSLF